MSEQISTNTLQSIDRTDTISTLIDKLNHNFSVITDSGIFDVPDEESEDHDLLCDTILIKPHTPIHRREHVYNYDEDENQIKNKTIEWLNNIKDYLIGDVVIVDVRRSPKITDEDGSDITPTYTYMYTIQLKNSDEIELIGETCLNGVDGANGKIEYNDIKQSLDLNGYQFTELNTNVLNVDSNATIKKLNITGNLNINSTQLLSSAGGAEFTYLNTKKSVSTDNINSYSGDKINIYNDIKVTSTVEADNIKTNKITALKSLNTDVIYPYTQEYIEIKCPIISPSTMGAGQIVMGLSSMYKEYHNQVFKNFNDLLYKIRFYSILPCLREFYVARFTYVGVEESTTNNDDTTTSTENAAEDTNSSNENEEPDNKKYYYAILRDYTTSTDGSKKIIDDIIESKQNRHLLIFSENSLAQFLKDNNTDNKNNRVLSLISISDNYKGLFKNIIECTHDSTDDSLNNANVYISYYTVNPTDQKQIYNRISDLQIRHIPNIPCIYEGLYNYITTL
ncbi:MAG: hypothetical protein NC548_27500 [Lachnospiraceae bacterium]|nr:hypothetical protein [Lachnospiraceae bacterium]